MSQGEELNEFTRRSKQYADLIKSGVRMEEAIATAFAIPSAQALDVAVQAQSWALTLLWSKLMNWESES